VAVEQQLHLVQVLHNLASAEQVQWIGVRLQRQHHLQVLAVMVILLTLLLVWLQLHYLRTPSAGDIISIADYASTFQTNNVTLCNNSSKINGSCNNASLSTEGQSITLVYVDATRGWKNTMDSTSNVTGAPNYIVATGGDTTITNGDFKIHAFTSDGTLCVSNAGTPAGSSVLEYLVVAGGGSGGLGDGGGGGAGGFRYFSALSPAGSPLVAPAGISASVASFPITIGGGGAAVPAPAIPARGNSGSNSIFSTITSVGGGGGGANNQPKTSVQDGGSGGGGVAGFGAGCGNTPPVSPPQGQNGTSGPSQGGGGGGAGGVGGPSPGLTGGKGGLGSYLPDTFFGPTAPSYGTSGPESSTRYFSGGAGGHGDSVPGPVPDGGGGGRGSPGTGTAGTANTGGGGGGGQPTASGAGGSGVVIIRYKFQN
jgi:hypothetical protein